MKFFLSKSSQGIVLDRTRVNRDFYEFHKTVSHGFPANPTCLAYDSYHQLLAIGTKHGAVQIFGKPGVEFHYEFDPEIEVIKLLVLPNNGQIICLCSDFSLHLLQISHQLDHQSITQLHSNEHFVNDGEVDSPDKCITTLALSRNGDTLFIGVKSGNVHLLDVSSFELKIISISQEQILKAIPEELKKPGSIECIEESPNERGIILIGFSRSLIALWNYNKSCLQNYFIIEQQLESLSWNDDGLRFISAHNDGSYIIWTAKQESHTSTSSSKLPYGPFPCKAITKIAWKCTNNGELFIFSGGMPRSSYGDKEVVSIILSDSENINSEKNHVLDFTSKVVDFLIISTGENIPEALVVLLEEEIVLIDLTHPDWLQHKLPYLSCLHSSPITCTQHYSNVGLNVYNRIVEAGNSDCTVRYSPNQWPIKGGISKYKVAGETNDLLISGHEDGTVRFWDASSTALKHLHTLNTSKIFLSNDDDIALIDGDDDELDGDYQNEWPPFRKVGQFDPYSDDHRLAIRKIVLCPKSGILAVGGTAGQLLVFELQAKAAEFELTSTKVQIVEEKDGFVWKGHSALNARGSKLKFGPGYQPSSLLQLYPPAALTALNLSTQWQVVAAGTAHGFCLYNYHTKILVACKSTLKQSGHFSVAGGDALISRRKSFKKSLRESFRRLRKGRSQKGKRNVANVANHKLATDHHGKLGKFEELEAKPVERQIEARTEADMMSSMVRYLYFCSAAVVHNISTPSFWIGTNAGTVFIYILSDKSSTTNEATWQLAKEVQLKHKAPIVFIRLLDSSGAPVFEYNQDQQNERNSLSRVIICSEEQFKLFSMPNFKTLHKFKLTAHEGARVRRIELALFDSKSTPGQSEYSLVCLSNLGDASIYSVHDFKRKFQNHFLKKEDINAITSLIFTQYGEGFYLKSSSEYQRFTLSSKRTNFPECFIQLPQPQEQATKKTTVDHNENGIITDDHNNSEIEETQQQQQKQSPNKPSKTEEVKKEEEVEEEEELPVENCNGTVETVQLESSSKSLQVEAEVERNNATSPASQSKPLIVSSPPAVES